MVESTRAVTETFSTLADPIRRYTLYYLIEQESPVSVNRLATRVAAWHTDTPPHAVDESTFTEIRTVLHHVHLPKLAELDIITYEDNAGAIAPTNQITSLDPFLAQARPADIGAPTPAD